MALMLLPHWTDGCIASMEGLFFEASGTTPYHFLTTAAMSEQSSNPVRQLRYVNNNAAVGVQHMHDLGVRYLMVRTDKAKAEADAQGRPRVHHDVGTVEHLRTRGGEHRRAAARCSRSSSSTGTATNASATSRSARAGSNASEDWAAMPADDGPDEWQRIPVEIDIDARVGEPDDRSRNVDYVVPAEPIDVVDLEPVTVSNVDIEQQSISFDVDEIGVPVLVRVSYFPTWKVDGADGPYRVAPNFMVVDAHGATRDAELSKTPLDWFFYSLTFVRHRPVRLLASARRHALPERASRRGARCDVDRPCGDRSGRADSVEVTSTVSSQVGTSTSVLRGSNPTDLRDPGR